MLLLLRAGCRGIVAARCPRLAPTSALAVTEAAPPAAHLLRFSQVAGGQTIRLSSTKPRESQTSSKTSKPASKRSKTKEKRSRTPSKQAAPGQHGITGFNDLTARIEALRLRELRMLTGDHSASSSSDSVLKSKTDARDTCSKMSESTARAVHTCQICGKEFTSEKRLRNHGKKGPKKCRIVADKPVQSDAVGDLSDPTPAVLNGVKSQIVTDKSLNGSKSVAGGGKVASDGKVGKAAKKSKVAQAAAELTDQESLAHKLAQKQPILIAYFDLLVSLGRVGEAHEELKLLRLSPDASVFIRHVDIYDRLLRGFARERNFSKVQVVWKDMLFKELVPSVDSYISAIISLNRETRLGSSDKTTAGVSDPRSNLLKSVFRQVYAEFKESYEGQSNRSVEEFALEKGTFQFSDRKDFIASIRGFLPSSPLAQAEPDAMSGSDRYSNPLVSPIHDVPPSLIRSHLDGVLRREDLDPLVELQLKNEASRTVTIPSICQQTSDATTGSEILYQFTSSLEAGWRQRLESEVARRLAARRKLPLWLRGQTINMHLFLSCIPISAVVDIILANAKEIIQNSENYSPPSSALAFKLGSDVMAAYHLHHQMKLDPNFKHDFETTFSDYLNWYADPRTEESHISNHRSAIEKFSKKYNYNLHRCELKWPAAVRSAVGNQLRNIILQEITLTRDKHGEVVVNNKILTEDGKLMPPVAPLATSPAFFKVYRTRKDSLDNEELKPHPSLSKLYQTNKMSDLQFFPVELPMLCPPHPWVSSHTGAYLLRSSQLIRVSEQLVSEQEERIKNLEEGTLNPVIDAVNHLGSVPWKVNLEVLNLAKEVFISQNDREVMSALSLPLHPDNIAPPQMNQDLKDLIASSKRLSGEQLKAYGQYQQNKSLHAQIKSESYSQWCDTLYRLSIADHYKDRLLWFPHNMDFRGRVYPLPPHLNHMGSDLAKSLLVFARGKPLGPDGFTWLKLHCINLTGAKKRASIAERLAYADSVLEDGILDSANNPLNGNRWYLESDEPWLTFSACCEIRNALQHPDGVENYVCHLPIHQDGSCNGLQHYAAIGRDRLGAAAVNLVPSDRPQDVYSEIAAIVERKRQEDADRGTEIASILEGFVRRKVVKQTVMTTVYGVTKYGATKQIARQLKDIDEYPAAEVDAGSKYLATKTFESLNEMFTASQEIQDWLTECAKVIAGDCNSNVEWVTPLGLPVVQPYTRYVLNMVGTNRPADLNDKAASLEDSKLLSLGRKLRIRDKVKKVNTLKHRNGFPPNFIHSLDSSHMMLTALYLWAQGITFASVHDCYWTHACDVPLMNRTCRDQFIALHSYPIIEKLSEFFLERYVHLHDRNDVEGAGQKEAVDQAEFTLEQIEAKKREILFKNIPNKGELNLDIVKNSTFFFS